MKVAEDVVRAMQGLGRSLNLLRVLLSSFKHRGNVFYLL